MINIPVLTLTWIIVGVLGASIVAALVLLLLAMKRVSKLEARYERLLQGTEGGNLESVLNQHLVSVSQALVRVDALQITCDDINVRLSKAVQHVGIVRFNPFADTGGDLSFALALADAEGNGVVICNLHGRGDSRLFAKPLQAWQSAYSLSNEESQAVQMAREHVMAEH